MRPYKREVRVISLIKEIAADYFLRGAQFPELVVTEVRMSPDLRNATILFRLIETAEGQVGIEAATERLESARQGLVARMRKDLTLKVLPRLDFRYDKGLDHAERVNSILRELNLAATDTSAAGEDSD